MLRLTLRTLLAYLDDTLLPSEAREIGQQIADEPSLNELITRIRDSMRKRRLVADSPDADDAKLDPNEVAEYLDSVLPASRVIELEKRALESDQDLAEVASVHQILSLVLVKPADLTDAAKEKAYRVIKSRARSHTELAPVGPARASFAASTRVRDEQPIPFGMNELESAGTQTRLFTAVAVAALLLILTSLIFVTLIGVDGVRAMIAGTTDDAVLARSQPAAPQPEDREAIPPANIPNPSEPPPTNPPASSDGGEKAVLPVDPLDEVKEIEPSDVPPSDAPPAVPPVPPPTVDEATPEVESEAASSPETPSREDPKEEEPAPAPVEVAEAKPENPSAPSESPAPAEPVPTTELVDRSAPMAAYTSPTGILLCRSEAGWSRLKSQEFLFSGDVIAHAEPGTAKIKLDNGVLLTLLDETRVQLGQGKEVARIALFGSAEFSLEKKSSIELAPSASTPITLDFGDESTLVKVSVDLIGWPTADAPSNPSRWRMRLECNKGSVQVGRGNAKRTIRPGQRIDMMSEEESIPESNSVDRSASDERSVAPTLERAVKKLSDLISYGPRPQQTFRELTENSNRDLRILAIRSLESLDQHDALAGALRHPRYSEVREESFQSLRRCLRRGSPGRESAERAIRDLYSDRDEVDLIELILGYSESAAGKKATYARLIELIDADELAVRECAIDNLVEWTGRNWGYSATGQSAQRKNAILKWQKWLETQGETVTIRRESEPTESEAP